MASSIQKGKGKEGIIAALLNHFERKYEAFVKEKSLAPFLDEYHNRLVSRNTPVQIISGEETVLRRCIGIDSTGAMIVQDEKGQEERIISGEVSVRGLYGYV
jgi:BirA family biotin operon repressor/biotin-[acetyl-CoA-carboxylase] ligase